MPNLDKKPFESKKFIFGFIGLLIIAGILVVALVTQTIGWALTAFMCVLGIAIAVIVVGYTQGQAGVDKLAAMVKSLPKFGESDDDSISGDNLD